MGGGGNIFINKYAYHYTVVVIHDVGKREKVAECSETEKYAKLFHNTSAMVFAKNLDIFPDI